MMRMAKLMVGACGAALTEAMATDFGELALTLPIGFIRDPGGVVTKDPDMAIQERLGLVFEMFLKFRTVSKDMRLLNDRGLDLPRRDRHGDLCRARATICSVTAILKNPAYAGAFVYGRTRRRALARDGASRAKAPRPIEEWRIVVKGRYPAYVDWQTYEMICSVIRDNRAEYMRYKTRGAPRDGDLLLHGITWCARCGHKMYVIDSRLEPTSSRTPQPSSSNIDSCAAVNDIVPSLACGQMNLPFSRRLLNRHRPCPSQQRIFIKSPRRPRKTNSSPVNGLFPRCC